ALTTLTAAWLAGPRLPRLEISGLPAGRWAVLVFAGALAAGGLFCWIRRRWLPSLREFWRELATTGRALLSRPRTALLAVGAGFLTQLLISLVLACSLRAVSSSPPPWVSMAWTFPVVGVVASAPVTLSGAGAREGAAMLLWAPFGVAAANAFSAGLLTLSANLCWAILGTLMLWSEAKRAKRRAISSQSSAFAR
ncbi:MAG: flippase-like domain-containing protein, partial [Verrucomicrobia bacterium]|nr:flippase-like domain-containing protein [Verrucomicrobiota bacterium]